MSNWTVHRFDQWFDNLRVVDDELQGIFLQMDVVHVGEI